MSDFIKADIFFFITSIAVIVLTIAALVVFFYIIKAVRTVKQITEIGKRLTEEMSSDYEKFREKVKDGPRVSTAIKFVKNLFREESVEPEAAQPKTNKRKSAK